jgi:hypothetical protein
MHLVTKHGIWRLRSREVALAGDLSSTQDARRGITKQLPLQAHLINTLCKPSDVFASCIARAGSAPNIGCLDDTRLQYERPATYKHVQPTHQAYETIPA